MTVRKSCSASLAAGSAARARRFVTKTRPAAPSKAVLALANEITYATAAFGEAVNPVVELMSRSYENSGGQRVFEPIFNVVGFVGDSSLDAVETLSDADIMTSAAARFPPERRLRGPFHGS